MPTEYKFSFTFSHSSNSSGDARELSQRHHLHTRKKFCLNDASSWSVLRQKKIFKICNYSILIQYQWSGTSNLIPPVQCKLSDTRCSRTCVLQYGRGLSNPVLLKSLIIGFRLSLKFELLDEILSFFLALPSVIPSQ